MSVISGSNGILSAIQSVNRNVLRHASKKAAGGGNKNPKQAPGNFKGIQIWEGDRAYENDIIVHKMGTLWFHPGLNVRLGGRNNLVATKYGTVRFTCEHPNLNRENRYVQKYYSGQEVDYKKYVHVIPPPMHTRFKHVKSV